MDVFEIGTEVLLDSDIPARVTAVCIKGIEHRLTYEVTWWDERVRKTEWVDPYEVRAKAEARRKTLRFA